MAVVLSVNSSTARQSILRIDERGSFDHDIIRRSDQVSVLQKPFSGMLRIPCLARGKPMIQR